MATRPVTIIFQQNVTEELPADASTIPKIRNHLIQQYGNTLLMNYCENFDILDYDDTNQEVIVGCYITQALTDFQNSHEEIQRLQKDLKEEKKRNNALIDIYNDEFGKVNSKFDATVSETKGLVKTLKTLNITSETENRAIGEISKSYRPEKEKGDTKKVLGERIEKINEINKIVSGAIRRASSEKENLPEKPKNEFDIQIDRNISEVQPKNVQEDSEFRKLCLQMSETGTENRKLRNEIDKCKTEIRILKRSLHLSYSRYASLTSRKLLDMLARCVYDQHSHFDAKQDSKCNYTREDLEDNNKKVSNFACLDHLKDCELLFSNICAEFKDILTTNHHLNSFVHSIDDLDEVIISPKVQNMNTCAQMLNKVIRYLKTNCPDEEAVQRLPEEVTKVAEISAEYKNYECYKLAESEEVQ